MLKKLIGALFCAVLILTLAAPANAACADGFYECSNGSCVTDLSTCPTDDGGTTDPTEINTYFRAGGSETAAGFAQEAALGEQDLSATISGIINVALGFLGVVAVVIILAGGFKWMTAGGNDDKVKQARHLLIAGLIGLIIVLAAYAIATFVIKSIVTATGA